MKRKIFGLSLILCLAAVLCFASVFSTRDVAKAENTDVLVSLTDDSLLTAYEDYFVYTNAKGIYIARDNEVLSYEEKSDFDGFIDIAINSTHILALAQKGDEKYLWAYKYNDKIIEKIDNFTPKDVYVEELVAIGAIDTNDESDGERFYVMETDRVKSISIVSPEDTEPHFLSKGSPYENVKGFIVFDKILYCVSEGNLYAIDNIDSKDTDLSKFLKRSGDYIDICISNNKIILLSASGIYQYNETDSSIKTLVSDGLNGNSKICSAYDSTNNVHYVYTKSNLNAVSMYVHTQSDLEYYGCFDNTRYEHPEEFDIIKLYKTGSALTLFSSPRHLQRMGTIPKDSYIIALSERDEYIYVYYRNEAEDKTLYGYIQKTANVTLCPADSQGILGEFAQPLHENTEIRKYPFEGANSPKLLDASIFMQLIVIDNVGQDGDFTWGWYKVGFVDSSGKTQYGYVKTHNLSPYTLLTAPALSRSAKLTSKKLGQYITLYALPFEYDTKKNPGYVPEDAIEVTQLPEGTSVYLREKYNKNSAWTTVYYEGKTAYVKTANIKPSGMTSWQIALAITIPCVAVATAVAIILIVLAKKKKLSYKS